MKQQDIKDVLTFAAFRPDPDDHTSPMDKRMLGKRYLLLNLSRDKVSWRSVGRKGEFEDTGSTEGELKDVAPQMAEEWKGLTDNGWVVVSINNRFVISPENNLSRRAGYEKMIGTNPKSILGAKCDRSKRYAVHHNPETSASILLGCDDSLIKSVEDALKGIQMQTARVCCGVFGMAAQYLNQIYSAGGKEKMEDVILLVCCEGSVLVICQRQGQWTELRARSAVYQDDIGPVAQLTAPFFQDLKPETPVVFINDRQETPFAQRMADGLKNFNLQNLTQPDHLWTVIGKN
ncbi:MAG: hypothetical protein ACC661_00410 [Verrucomicrobiales bacterium]